MSERKLGEGDVAWLECADCGGVFAIFRHPHALPEDGMLVTAATFIGLDGEDIPPSSLCACLTCGGLSPFQFHSEYFRRGDRLPLKAEMMSMDEFAPLSEGRWK